MIWVGNQTVLRICVVEIFLIYVIGSYFFISKRCVIMQNFHSPVTLYTKYFVASLKKNCFGVLQRKFTLFELNRVSSAFEHGS